MPRSFFSKVFLQSVLVLLALTTAGGLALDRFLSQSEIERLGDQVERFALMLKEDESRLNDGAILQEHVKRLGESTKVRFTVVARDGRVLADSLLDPAKMENHSTHPEVAEALAGREGRNLRLSASLGVEMLYVALPGDTVVRAAVSVSEVRAAIGELRKRMALAAIPAILIALGLAYLLAKSLNKRVERMIRFTSALEKGDFSQNIRAEGDDELSDMERGLFALRDEIQKKVEALRIDKEALAGLVEGLPHALMVFDKDKNLTLANSPARALLRIGEEKGGILSAAETIRNPRVLQSIEAVAKGEPSPEPFRLVWAEPSIMLEVAVHSLVGQSGGADILVVLRDVSKEFHLEKVRSDFMVNLSHELRTPLTAIRGSAETLVDAVPADPLVTQKFLETIRRNALRLEALLGDVSDLARAEGTLDPVKKVVFDGRDPACHVHDLFLAEASKSGINFELKLPEEAVLLESDAEKVEQVLINLVQNALRYTPGGGRVTITLSKTNHGAEYEVSDTGIGIPAEALPRITERFYRVDPGRSRAMGGTGLGLAIVKHICESLGIKLEIASEPGKGTQVKVIL